MTSPPPRIDGVLSRPTSSFRPLALKPRHVERNGDEQVRTRADRTGGRRRIVELGDDPDVADVVAVAGSLGVGTIDVRREQTGLIQRADERQIVVAEGGGV